MSKKTTSKPNASGPPLKNDPPVAWSRTLRETVESVVIAFILAFLFRTFEAEAFVIPTGSMAPTLQGRHKDLICPKCGYQYRVNASDEESDGRPVEDCEVISGTCPMCRWTLNARDFPSYNGDRIIVSKLAYDLAEPERWDVVVFKYPEDARMNYIKRLVGLPGEAVRILYGDIYTAPLGSDTDGAFEIARKPPDKARSMLIPVYDNDYVVPELIDAGLEPRWAAASNAGLQTQGWKVSDDYKSFRIESAPDELAWLRYRNIVPTEETWQQFLAGRKISSPRPSLITDNYAYNDGRNSARCKTLGQHGDSKWVGDLALDANLHVANDVGSIVLELVKGGRAFQCRIDIATGRAQLIIPDLADFGPSADTALRGPGTYEVGFANIDRQLFLWINGQVVAFDKPTTYPPLDNLHPVAVAPDSGREMPTDLAPAGIAVQGGAELTASNLRVWRDIYYLIEPGSGADSLTASKDRSKVVQLGPDQFFVLGDNSPRSADGRYWSVQSWVDRRMMIGKALFVYWPHSFGYVEIGEKKIPFPFWPNFQQMRFVH